MFHLEWKIAEESIPTPILRRRVLESLGFDNREILLAARDRYRSDRDVKASLMDDSNEKESSSKIAALFSELVFHNSEAIESEGWKRMTFK